MSNDNRSESQGETSEPFRGKNSLPTVSDRYRLISLLGEGGMGTVYKAKDEVLNREVAIKLLPDRQISQTEAIRFQGEAKAVSNLKHPSIVEIYDFGFTDEQRPFMVLELVQGQTLGKVLDRENRLSIERTVELMLPLCRAISHAHSNGTLHRDIKPENIVVTPKDEVSPVRVLDFGISRLQTENAEQKLTEAGNVIGSPLYLSPEQAQGLPVDERSDIYSLGCVMFRCLTGVPPFRGENTIETLSKHLSEEVPSLAEKAGADLFSDQLEEIVRKTLEKDPEDRFQSVEELSEAISELAEVDLSPAQEPEEFQNRQRLISWRVGLFLTIGTLVFAGTVHLISQESSSNAKVGPKEYLSLATLPDQKTVPIDFTKFGRHGEEEDYEQSHVGIRRGSDAPIILTQEDHPADQPEPTIDELLKRGLAFDRKTVFEVVNYPLERFQLLKIFAEPDIACIRLENCGLRSDDFEGVVNLDSYRTKMLSLKNNPIDANVLIHLKGLEQVKTLNLESTDMEGNGLPIIAKQWPNLVNLYLSHSKIRGKDLPSLWALSRLEVLNLAKIEGLNDESLEKLLIIPRTSAPRFKSLHTIAITNNKGLTDGCMNTIDKCIPPLTEVRIKNCTNISMPVRLELSKKVKVPSLEKDQKKKKDALGY